MQELNPYFVTGFVDAIGEESFYILVARNKNSKFGWSIRIYFQLKVAIKDRELLVKIQEALGSKAEKIISNKSSCMLKITSVPEIINTIIPHFDKYPLLSKTKEEFELFKLAAFNMHNKRHYTPEGFQEILSIKAAMNKGLTGLLSESFSNTMPILAVSDLLLTKKEEEPSVNSLDPNWVAGFTEGKGFFKIDVQESPGELPVKLNFEIFINEKDKKLLVLISKFFGCGTYKIDEKGSPQKIFTLTNFDDISNIVATFFIKYPLQGMKKLDLDLFIKVIELIKNKGDQITIGELEKTLGRKFTTKLDLDLRTYIPINKYTNADTHKVLIVKDNIGKSGVYCWVHNQSGTRYVGSSINLGKRFSNYYNLNHLMKHNMSIYKALLKYGHSNFSLDILEYCDINSITEREQYFINLLAPKYNILKIAGSPSGYKHTPETIEKLRLLGAGRKHSEETKAKLRAANKGRSVSKKVRLKISETKLKANFKHSEEAKLRIGESSLARYGWVTSVTNVKTGKTENYLSRLKAAAALNIAPLTLKRYGDSQKLYLNTYKITFIAPN